MAKLEYFIVCAATSIDAGTSAISLFHVLEDIFPDDFPDDLPNLEAVSLWILGPEDAERDYQATLRVTLPGQVQAASFPMNLDPSRGRNRLRAIQGVRHIPLLASGELKIEVLLNGVHAADHTITVHPVAAIRSGEEIQVSLPLEDDLTARTELDE